MGSAGLRASASVATLGSTFRPVWQKKIGQSLALLRLYWHFHGLYYSFNGLDWHSRGFYNIASQRHNSLSSKIFLSMQRFFIACFAVYKYHAVVPNLWNLGELLYRWNQEISPWVNMCLKTTIRKFYSIGAPRSLTASEAGQILNLSAEDTF